MIRKHYRKIVSRDIVAWEFSAESRFGVLELTVRIDSHLYAFDRNECAWQLRDAKRAFHRELARQLAQAIIEHAARTERST